MKFLANILNSTSAWTDFFVLCAGVLLPAAGVIVWAVFIRGKRRRRHRHRRSASCPASRTLAQAGGLPPVRKHNNVTDSSES